MKITIQKLYALIEKNCKHYSVQYLSSIYKVSRAGYYKWLKRKDTINSYQTMQRDLDLLIQEIHQQNPTFGYRTTRDRLTLETGWKVCDISVWRSMKRLKIKGYIRKSRFPTSTGAEHIKYPNKLARSFKSRKPLEKLVTDITYIKHKGKWNYLACFLDLYNNEIVEWELSSVLDNYLVIKPAKRLLEKIKSTEYPKLLHSDQGIQYSSAGYRSLLKGYNVIQSMSRAGTPRDNAVMESFFGRFKDVLRIKFRYWQKEDLQQTISDAITYFNKERPVRKLNGKTPVQYRIELAL
ncbi:IS3 family transposase [Phascolarctobacterium faecium]|uniref:IS3 family transposase n=1 Tax=Phascolarctobacterium faecium TaxID=33025 RepID=UPI0040278C9A